MHAANDYTRAVTATTQAVLESMKLDDAEAGLEDEDNSALEAQARDVLSKAEADFAMTAHRVFHPERLFPLNMLPQRQR